MASALDGSMGWMVAFGIGIGRALEKTLFCIDCFCMDSGAFLEVSNRN